MPIGSSSASALSKSGQYAPDSQRQHVSPLDRIPCTKTTATLPFGFRSQWPFILKSLLKSRSGATETERDRSPSKIKAKSILCRKNQNDQRKTALEAKGLKKEELRKKKSGARLSQFQQYDCRVKITC